MTFSKILRSLPRRPLVVAALVVSGVAFTFAVTESTLWLKIVLGLVAVGSLRGAVWALRR